MPPAIIWNNAVQPHQFQRYIDHTHPVGILKLYIFCFGALSPDHNQQSDIIPIEIILHKYEFSVSHHETERKRRLNATSFIPIFHNRYNDGDAGTVANA